MAKIFVIMGKSASGKDTVYRRLRQALPALHPVVPYTTRPQRSGEQNGVDYYFVDETFLEACRAEGRLIEHRCYQTMHGPWHYFTVDDGQIKLAEGDYLLLLTPEGFAQLQAYFGREAVVPLLLTVEDGLRLARALERERAQASPKYAELCRRFLADEVDFAPEKLQELGITRSFCNESIADCVDALKREIALQG